jgi:uncharacterized zinc-type alcohol dehydrogenase-like protein
VPAVNALVTDGPGQRFRPTTIDRRELGAADVLIDIAYCGLCHSDLSYASNQWGRTLYPLVPGHEIVGIVAAVGSEVTRFTPGDRAGVGCLVQTCGYCSNCLAGYEQHCYGQRVSTYSSPDADGRPTQGGYSEKIVVDEKFVVSISHMIPLQNAAPLLCAGVTVYSPLIRWGAGPGKRVGIVGFGGLGHVAVQLARALGAEAAVFDVSQDKREDALRLGAADFVATTNAEAFNEFAHTLDLILCTVPANVDINAYLGLLALGGTFVTIGVPQKPLTIDAFSLIVNQRAIAGSRIGGLAETQQMLDFCADHDIGAEVEIIGANEIETAYERLKSGDVRFRFVLDTSTIANGTNPAQSA